MNLPDGEDFLFRPVLLGALRAESLLDGSVDLEFVAKLNDALDAKAENEARQHAALTRK